MDLIQCLDPERSDRIVLEREWRSVPTIVHRSGVCLLLRALACLQPSLALAPLALEGLYFVYYSYWQTDFPPPT